MAGVLITKFICLILQGRHTSILSWSLDLCRWDSVVECIQCYNWKSYSTHFISQWNESSRRCLQSDLSKISLSITDSTWRNITWKSCQLVIERCKSIWLGVILLQHAVGSTITHIYSWLPNVECRRCSRTSWNFCCFHHCTGSV